MITAAGQPELAHLYGMGADFTEQQHANAAAIRGLVLLDDRFAQQVMRRAVQQAILEALPSYWLRRAETFERVGTPTAWDSAVACRRHAWLLAQPPTAAEVA